jgi:hypothetical protein
LPGSTRQSIILRSTRRVTHHSGASSFANFGIEGHSLKWTYSFNGRGPALGAERKTFALVPSLTGDPKPGASARTRPSCSGTAACRLSAASGTRVGTRRVSRNTAPRVPDAVQREAVHRRSGIASQWKVSDWDGPRKSGLPDLRACKRRSRVNPRSVSAAHHSAPLHAALRPGHARRSMIDPTQIGYYIPQYG